MAKGGKLGKLKSVLKKMQSLKLGRGGAPTSPAISDSSSKDLHIVYVGKSRRRYLISSDVLENPLFREVIHRRHDDDDDASLTVGCEVVLFEHLLWMLENSDLQPESLDELAQFYAC